MQWYKEFSFNVFLDLFFRVRKGWLELLDLMVLGEKR